MTHKLLMATQTCRRNCDVHQFRTSPICHPGSMDGEHYSGLPEVRRADAPCVSMPRLGGLPDLRTYDCKQCGVALTEAYEPTQNAGSLT